MEQVRGRGGVFRLQRRFEARKPALRLRRRVRLLSLGDVHHDVQPLVPVLGSILRPARVQAPAGTQSSRFRGLLVLVLDSRSLLRQSETASASRRLVGGNERNWVAFWGEPSLRSSPRKRGPRVRKAQWFKRHAGHSRPKDGVLSHA